MNILIKDLPADDKRFDGIIALLNELHIDWSFLQLNDGKPIVSGISSNDWFDAECNKCDWKGNK